MRFGKKKIPHLFYLISVIYLGYCFLFTPNFWLSIPIVIYPMFAFRLLWIDNQPNVLFFGVMLQWLSSATQLLYCNFLGITLDQKMRNTVIPPHTMEPATILSIVGVFFFTIGIYIAIRKLKFLSITHVSNAYSPRKVLIFYVAFSIFIYLTSTLIWAFPGIVQYVHFFFYLKWGFFLITFYILHTRRSFLRLYFYTFLAAETFLGLTSFFAGELVYIALFTILSITVLQPGLKVRSYILISVGVIFLIHYLILWSAIKKEYRAFVTSGEKSQSVLVSGELAREKFVYLITNVDSKHYQKGLEEFVDRVGYIQFFAACLDYVPRKVPHQNGDIYLSAFQHYLIPRFLNPGKEVLDDSKHTAKYTGIQVRGAKQASSFSLGYIADAYIDFGFIYMFPLLFAVGYLFGFLYRYLVKRSPNALWVWVFTAPFFILLNINGADTKKALGWILIYFITVAVLRKQLIKRIDPVLRISK